ncbi:MAG: 50S ribosomal protein L14e [archaeon GB-1867-097]|nr:50S ribosomal protein L14e [Candidatus Culexmicrobium thermophilum]MCS7385100.1 50S ribosomal protein L14e [Candidatus Culexmicrobium thermophilum]
MVAIDIGRICVKTRGREAGKKCIIVDIIDDKYVLITGPKELTGVKRRRVNIKHIEPTELKIEIKPGVSDEEVIKALEEQGLLDKIKEKIRVEIY